MKPRYVVYECENCDKLFYRDVTEVLVDDVDHCEVKVALLGDNEGNIEEFPMCGCLGGEEAHVIGSPTEVAE